MSALKEQISHAGYSQEELYFHKLNQELIEKMKAEGKKPIKKGALTLVHSQSEPSSGVPGGAAAHPTPRKKAA